MDAIDALPRNSLRAPQRTDSLRSTLRPAPASAASATRPAGSSESATTRSAGSSESRRCVLSGDGIVAISKSRARVGATVACFAGRLRAALAPWRPSPSFEQRPPIRPVPTARQAPEYFVPEVRFVEHSDFDHSDLIAGMSAGRRVHRRRWPPVVAFRAPLGALRCLALPPALASPGGAPARFFEADAFEFGAIGAPLDAASGGVPEAGGFPFSFAGRLVRSFSRQLRSQVAR